MFNVIPEGREKGNGVEAVFLALTGKNFLEPMNEYMKGYIEPFNGQLCFGDSTSCFRQPRAQKILMGDSGPSLFLAKGHDIIQHQIQCSKGHKKRAKNQLLPVSAAHPPAASSCSFFLPQALLPSH